MANFNKVFLIGNLTRDPELRYIPSGTAVASFGLATNRVYTGSSGEKKQETCFVRVVVWGRTAEICGEYLSKGSPAFIEGRLQYRSWEGQNGEKRSTLEVCAERVQFLGRGKKDNAGQGDKSQGVDNIDLNEEYGGPQSGGQKGPSQQDEEVPF